jgi:hypothetical protein
VEGLFELHRICAGRVDEPVEKNPCQRVRRFVTKHLIGLRLPHCIAEEDHEAFFQSKALAQHGFEEPGSPNDDGNHWKGSSAEGPPKRSGNRASQVGSRKCESVLA